jgi:hypothetical protein
VTNPLSVQDAAGTRALHVGNDGKLRVKSGGIVIHDELGAGRLGFAETNESDPRIVLYRGGQHCEPNDGSPDITILRNFPQSADPCVVYTILKIWAPSGAVGNDREATLALVRGDNDEEFMDVYNNGYGQSTQWHYGIRIQRRGSGAYRDFDIEQAFGSAANEKKFIMVVRPTRKVGIGTKATPSKLSVKGESFTATGTVSVPANTATVNGVDNSTLFLQEVDPGDKVTISTQTRTVVSVDSETSLTVDSAFSGSPSGTMTVINHLFRVEDSSGNVKLFVTDQGNVGIDVAGPEEKLDVNGALCLVDGMTAPDTHTGKASIYVDSADGDLKVKFGDGTVKVIATDT